MSNSLSSNVISTTNKDIHQNLCYIKELTAMIGLMRRGDILVPILKYIFF